MRLPVIDSQEQKTRAQKFLRNPNRKLPAIGFHIRSMNFLFRESGFPSVIKCHTEEILIVM